MNDATTSVGCGSEHCACASQRQIVPASVNGIALHEPGEHVEANLLRERALAEVLRQHAVQRGLLPRHAGLLAPELGQAERHVIEAMTDDEVKTPWPCEDECRRYYEANKAHFIVGQGLHVRHILFAVTPGVNVHKLSHRAEAALLELTRQEVAPGRFEQLAAELSNCPSSTQGGDLGWVTPEDCAPELANELFFQTDSRWGMGVHQRLVHTRFGLHIIEVMGRRKGQLPSFDEVQERIKARLSLQSRTTALRQYLQVLVGQARIEGVALEGATSPLVQ